MAEKTVAEVRELELLRQIIRRQMNNRQDALVNAEPASLAEVQYKRGLIHGLAIAERELLSLDDKLVHDEDL